jgi:hypothetical protein
LFGWYFFTTREQLGLEGMFKSDPSSRGGGFKA